MIITFMILLVISVLVTLIRRLGMLIENRKSGFRFENRNPVFSS